MSLSDVALERGVMDAEITYMLTSMDEAFLRGDQGTAATVIEWLFMCLDQITQAL